LCKLEEVSDCFFSLLVGISLGCPQGEFLVGSFEFGVTFHHNT
jgi:hypothetical protein